MFSLLLMYHNINTSNLMYELCHTANSKSIASLLKVLFLSFSHFYVIFIFCLAHTHLLTWTYLIKQILSGTLIKPNLGDWPLICLALINVVSKF